MLLVQGVMLLKGVMNLNFQYPGGNWSPSDQVWAHGLCLHVFLKQSTVIACKDHVFLLLQLGFHCPPAHIFPSITSALEAGVILWCSWAPGAPPLGFCMSLILVADGVSVLAHLTPLLLGSFTSGFSLGMVAEMLSLTSKGMGHFLGYIIGLSNSGLSKRRGKLYL